MAPLPTIANVFRIAWNWPSSMGVRPVNIFHVRCTDTGDVSAIAAAIGDAASPLTLNPWRVLHGGYSLSSVFVTPLDGSTAGTDQALGVTMQGSDGGEAIIQGAGLVSFHTARRGSRGRGRLYVGPMGEGQQADGIIVGAAATEMLGGWNDWTDNMLAGSPSIEFGVASYTHADFHALASIRIDTVVATQRRRLDQLR